MPAISADTITLPRVADPGPAAQERAVLSVTDAPSARKAKGSPSAGDDLDANSEAGPRHSDAPSAKDH